MYSFSEDELKDIVSQMNLIKNRIGDIERNIENIGRIIKKVEARKPVIKDCREYEEI